MGVGQIAYPARKKARQGSPLSNQDTRSMLLEPAIRYTDYDTAIAEGDDWTIGEMESRFATVTELEAAYATVADLEADNLL